MEITQLRFQQNKPVEVSLTMSVLDAARLARLLGKVSPANVGIDNWQSLNELYDLITGDLFNRFWDDGINDYFREQ